MSLLFLEFSVVSINLNAVSIIQRTGTDKYYIKNPTSPVQIFPVI